MTTENVIVTVECGNCGHVCEGPAEAWIDRPCPNCFVSPVISLDYLRDYHARLTRMIAAAKKRQIRTHSKDDT